MTFLLGIVLTACAGILNGSFAVPTKKIVQWEWENTWFLYALTGMIVFPLLVSLFFIPDILSIYSTIEFSQLLVIVLLGIGWGTGSLLFGLALKMVGISVGSTVVIGGIAVFGTLLPLLVTTEQSFFNKEGISLLISVFFIIIGIVCCGLASKMRERENTIPLSNTNSPDNFKSGILLSVIAALLSSMLNLAFHFGNPIAEAARNSLGEHSAPFLINHTIWQLVLAAGFLPYLLYCGSLLIKNKTFKQYSLSVSRVNGLYAILMAVIWFSCIVMYGLGSEKLGKYGVSLGWLILMASTVIAGNIWGIVTNEWNGTSAKAKKLMFAGILFLLGNIFIIGIPKIFNWN